MDLNYSTYITIENQSSYEFTKVLAGSSHGSYKVYPKQTLPPKASTEYHLLSGFGADGSEGWTTYHTDLGVLQLDYACPYGLLTKNSISVDIGSTNLLVWFRGVSGVEDYIKGVDKSQNGIYSKSGHPLSVAFLVKDYS